MATVKHFAQMLEALASRRGGNIAISAAAALPLVVATLALGVDYGKLTLDRRALQGHTDLAAIIATNSLSRPERAVAAYLKDNGLTHVVETEDGYIDGDGWVGAAAPPGRGLVEVETGIYSPRADLAPGERFAPAEDAGARTDAVRVTMREPGRIHFASLFTAAPELSASATAHATNMAAFSVGSRLLSLQGGVLNSVLGALLGSEVDLKVMDYEALIDTDISLLSMFDALAIELGLTGVTYGELLQSDVDTATFLSALQTLDGLDATARAAVSALANGASGNGRSVTLASLFDAGPMAAVTVGADAGLNVTAGLFDVLSAAATVANGDRQVALDLSLGLPGIASVKLALAIGEPPRGSAWIAVGARGAVVRTAQTRLMLHAKLIGSGSVSVVELPLYVEVAYGEAALAEIACGGNGAAGRVSLDARPGLLEASVGRIDPSRFVDFAREPVVGKAELVDLLLLKIRGSAHVESANIGARRVDFSASDIERAAIKSVSTDEVLGSLVASLTERLDLDVSVLGLGIGLGNPGAIVSGVLENAAAPLDRIVHNTLLALGIRVGEADLRVTGVRCGRASLVQ